jgi:co-chaperonin GroES (HSP10)
VACFRTGGCAPDAAVFVPHPAGRNPLESVIFAVQKKETDMSLIIEEKDLEKFIMVGDRVLIKPKTPSNKTKTGLYLPPTVQESEKIQSGYIVKVGPGYPIPAVSEEDEAWKQKQDDVRYVPLQAKMGDLAVYLNKSGFEIEFNKEKYIILPHSAILMIIRDENLMK